MDNEPVKRCPCCAELIKADAVKCRYCKSALTKSASGGAHWRRVNQGKLIAGVTTGIAREMNSPDIVLPLRLLFILAAFMGFGIILYLILWIIMPEPTDIHSKAETQPQHQSSPAVTAISILLVVFGVIFIVLHGRDFILYFSRNFPEIIPRHYPYLYPPRILYFPGFWFTLVAILLIAIIGIGRTVRAACGCMLVILGLIFLLVMLPFIPLIIISPLLVVGVIFIIAAGIALLADR